METKYRASLDRTSKIITISIVVVLVSIVVGIWVFPKPEEGLGPKIFTSSLLSILMLVCYAFSPTAYSFSNKGIIVHRSWSNVLLPYSKISSARIIEKVSKKGLIRVMGNGGLFGYYGDFRNSEMGYMEWYVRHRSNIVLLETAAAKILLSPDEPGKFLSELQTKISVLNH